MKSHPRVPKQCPAGFTDRNTVVPGDTMFLIAKRFGVSLGELIDANPHISNPNILFPGDVLCVPPPKKPINDIKCPCPVTLLDFINRQVEVTTLCATVTGNLTEVGDVSITLRDPRTDTIIIIRCQEICFVRIFRRP